MANYQVNIGVDMKQNSDKANWNYYLISNGAHNYWEKAGGPSNGLLIFNTGDTLQFYFMISSQDPQAFTSATINSCDLVFVQRGDKSKQNNPVNSDGTNIVQVISSSNAVTAIPQPSPGWLGTNGTFFNAMLTPPLTFSVDLASVWKKTVFLTVTFNTGNSTNPTVVKTFNFDPELQVGAGIG